MIDEILKSMDFIHGQSHQTVSTESRRISAKAAERLACPRQFPHLDSRPPPPSKVTYADDNEPPPLPPKGIHRREVGPLLDKQVPAPVVQTAPTHVVWRPPRDPSRLVPPSRVRAVNEYVDSPHRQVRTSQPEVVSEQPQKLKKENVTEHSERESIYCPKCGRCRCEDCRTPRKLPICWVCNKSKECSMEKMVDYCSCMCCVEAVFYHCCRDGEDSRVSDEPCACCEQPHCCQRWSCMVLLSLFLPCLCLYWPLKGCVNATQKCYGRCMVRGCRCHEDSERTGPQHTRHLLEPESSSGS